MIKCSPNCPPCCDFCIYAEHERWVENGVEHIGGPEICTLHNDEYHNNQCDGCGWCDDFHCASAKLVDMLKHNGYYALVSFDEEDKIFVGRVVGISDSVSFHGTSREELEEMFHQSINNYIALCKENGKIEVL